MQLVRKRAQSAHIAQSREKERGEEKKKCHLEKVDRHNKSNNKTQIFNLIIIIILKMMKNTTQQKIK
jgi:hypothetical protein